jgi:hypothetical protein
MRRVEIGAELFGLSVQGPGGLLGSNQSGLEIRDEPLTFDLAGSHLLLEGDPLGLPGTVGLLVFRQRRRPGSLQLRPLAARQLGLRRGIAPLIHELVVGGAERYELGLEVFEPASLGRQCLEFGAEGPKFSLKTISFGGECLMRAEAFLDDLQGIPARGGAVALDLQLGLERVDLTPGGLGSLLQGPLLRVAGVIDGST